MNQLKIKKSTLIKLLWLIFSIGYGLYAASYVGRHYILDSGDIMSLVRNSDAFESWDGLMGYYGSAANIFSSGDAIFRVAVLVLKNFLNMSTQNVLGILAFIISAITLFMSSKNIRPTKYLFFILILLIMVFLTPRVINLFASGIRSGIAFAILLAAFIYAKGTKKHFLFLVSTLVHLSMAPIIAFYFLFNWIENQRKKFSSSIYLLLLLSFSLLISIAAPLLNVSNSPVNQSMLYIALVAFLGMLMIVTDASAIRNIYGFISIGLIMLVLIGFMIEFSFVRYIGNAIILYVLFALKEGRTRTIHIFTIGYAPFFFITLYYSISNYW